MTEDGMHSSKNIDKSIYWTFIGINRFPGTREVRETEIEKGDIGDEVWTRRRRSRRRRIKRRRSRKKRGKRR